MADESAKTFDLSLVTPEGSLYEGEAQMLIVPGAAGEIGILPRHAPLVAMLRAGEVRIKTPDQWNSYAAGAGYFKMQRDRAIVLVDAAVRAEDIDVAQAEREVEEARALLERVRAGEEGIDEWQAEQRLRHAENKIAVAGRA